MVKRRFGMVPVLAVIVKVIAILLVIFVVYRFVDIFNQNVLPALKGDSPMPMDMTGKSALMQKIDLLVQAFSYLLTELIKPTLFWVAAELAMMFREMEYTVRVRSAEQLAAIEEAQAVVALPAPAAFEAAAAEEAAEGTKSGE